MEARPCRSYLLVHGIEPIRRDLSGTRAHIRQNDLRTSIKMVDKSVEPRRRVNVDFGDGPVKKMLQRSTRLVLCIKIQKRYLDVVRIEPFRQERQR